MEPLRPEGVQSEAVDVIVVLLDDSFWLIVAQEKLELENASSYSVGKAFLRYVLNKHASSVSKEADVKFAVVLPFKVYWVRAVELAVRLAVFVVRRRVLVPETVAAALEPETLASFAESENEVIVH